MLWSSTYQEMLACPMEGMMDNMVLTEVNSKTGLLMVILMMGVRVIFIKRMIVGRLGSSPVQE